jgi:hypothetical protein
LRKHDKQWKIWWKRDFHNIIALTKHKNTRVRMILTVTLFEAQHAFWDAIESLVRKEISVEVKSLSFSSKWINLLLSPSNCKLVSADSFWFLVNLKVCSAFFHHLSSRNKYFLVYSSIYYCWVTAYVDLIGVLFRFTSHEIRRKYRKGL